MMNAETPNTIANGNGAAWNPRTDLKAIDQKIARAVDLKAIDQKVGRAIREYRTCPWLTDAHKV